VRLYPTQRTKRGRAIALDAATVLCVLLFAWLGATVHEAVEELADLGEGVRGAGTAVQDGFRSAGDAVDDVPLVGGKIAEGLRDAGRDSGGAVESSGRKGEDAAHDLADLLGLLVFLLPTGLVLFRVLPGRVEQVRRLTAASSVLGDQTDPERRRLLASRAAFGLPYGQLLRHTRDPVGDLQAERYDGLLAALFEDAGLSESGPGSRSA
jgi:hypothetical protein